MKPKKRRFSDFQKPWLRRFFFSVFSKKHVFDRFSGFLGYPPWFFFGHFWTVLVGPGPKIQKSLDSGSKKHVKNAFFREKPKKTENIWGAGSHFFWTVFFRFFRFLFYGYRPVFFESDPRLTKPLKNRSGLKTNLFFYPFFGGFSGFDPFGWGPYLDTSIRWFHLILIKMGHFGSDRTKPVKKGSKKGFFGGPENPKNAFLHGFHAFCTLPKPVKNVHFGRFWWFWAGRSKSGGRPRNRRQWLL